jgi:hypothetical protein
MRIPRETSCMSKLVYITNSSLDAYVEDETGAFDVTGPLVEPDESGTSTLRYT